jgi:transcription antitermination factor NusG
MTVAVSDVKIDCESAGQPVSADLSSEPCGREHLKCVSHTESEGEISSEKLRHGGARRNAGGPRPHSGGARFGAGRKRKSSSELTNERIAASLVSMRSDVISGTRWYCAQTTWRMELIVLDQFIKAGFASFAPRIERELPDRTRITRLMFPGYVFSRFDVEEDPWQPLTRTPGVRGFLGLDAEHPTAAPFGVIETLVRAALCTTDSVIRRDLLPEPEPLVEGNAVRVLDGPLTSFHGVIKWSAGRRVGVLMTIFGRTNERPIDMPVELLEKVDADQARDE